MSFTHRLAAIGYLLVDSRFLLLKRTQPPKIWMPPGGRMNPDENPNVGVLREVREETGIEARLIAPVEIWHGDINGETVVSIDYLLTATNTRVVLSDEHSAFCWSSLDDIRAGKPDLGGTGVSFRLEHFERAMTVFHNLDRSGG